MSKRLIYLVLFALIGAFVMFQSCSETPVTTEDPVISDAGKIKYDVPNVFNATGKLIVKNQWIQDGLCTQIKLWAGAGNRESARWVGNVYLTKTGNNLHVVYDFDDASLAPWVPIDIHFDISGNYDGLHDNNSGNPSPGQFTYVHNFEYPYSIRNWGFDIDLSGITCETAGVYYAAAHASVIQLGGIEGFNFYLPNDPVQLVVQGNPAPNAQAYWKFTIQNAGFISTYNSGYGSGVYYGWCIDIDHQMGNGTYPAQLFSSYENLPSWLTGPGMLEYPENLDKVNYLVNHFNTGDMIQPVSSCGVPIGSPAALTYGDLQVAIWTLIENNTNYSGLGSWTQQKVNAILCDVTANGEGFTPGCDQKIVFIVVPNLGETISIQLVIGQPIIGMTPVPCETQSETCWGDGKWGANWFGGNSWATWFKINSNILICP